MTTSLKIVWRILVPVMLTHVVARELGQLDLDLMADDVHQLRKQVEVAVRNKLRAQRKNSGLAGEAQKALEVARADYLTKARELRTAQRQSS